MRSNSSLPSAPKPAARTAPHARSPVRHPHRRHAAPPRRARARNASHGAQDPELVLNV